MPKGDWLKVAILYDKTARYTPSNDTAINLFCESSISHKIYPTIITQEDIGVLSNFDGLFIRDTTHPGNPTFEFALEAERLGIKVIDSSISIMQGCNKIWQVEMFEQYKVPYPKTCIVNNTHKRLISIPYPCVLKIPDSCFSQGVYKAHDDSEFVRLVNELSAPKLVCQEFIESKFDWRITIFNHKFLFAIKYYMVDKDWKIVKYDRKGNYINGHHECVPFDKIPPHIITAAYKCDQFLTDGLYGIDIKEVNNQSYVIEINDNPSIDAGIEDEIEGNKIYDIIMGYFRQTNS